jgi:hypothetical protein
MKDTCKGQNKTIELRNLTCLFPIIKWYSLVMVMISLFVDESIASFFRITLRKFTLKLYKIYLYLQDLSFASCLLQLVAFSSNGEHLCKVKRSSIELFFSVCKVCKVCNLKEKLTTCPITFWFQSKIAMILFICFYF